MNCCECGAQINDGVRLFNLPNRVPKLKYLGVNEAVHLECYVHVCVRKALEGEREEVARILLERMYEVLLLIRGEREGGKP